MPHAEGKPTEARALGMLADLLRRSQALVADAAARGPSDAQAIVDLAAVHEVLRRRARSAQLEQAGLARLQAQHNQARAEVLLQRGKLQRRMDALRLGQQQAKTPELARALRRQRAELAVEAEQCDGQLARHDAALQQAREALGNAQQALQQAETEGRDTARELHALQRQAAPLAQAMAAVEVQLGLAGCRLFLGNKSAADVAAWRGEVEAAAAHLSGLHVAMATGRYPKDEADPYLHGRAMATAEALHALVAAGNLAAARTLFAAACPRAQFFHQIFAVFRAYCLGLYLQGDATAVADAVRLHRYADGLRGALANAWWALLQRDGAALAAELPRLVAYDWRTWSYTPTPAMGWVSTTACALARLGQARGLLVPADLGATVPAALWRTVARAP